MRQQLATTSLRADNFIMVAPHAAETAHNDTLSAPVTGLLKLPAELRLQIYGLIIAKLDASIVGRRLIEGHNILPSLLRVSKTIREDAIGLYQQHLRDVRVVLIGREEHVRKVMGNAMTTCYFSAIFPGSPLWRDRIDGYHKQLEDNRKWMVRVDQVAAQVTRSA
ncbi:hypothetical protein LTR17_010286 [Elasticomyces elasticus]|nr:hypothetical protein LTR17_010286 [Elasticomyces elasticus]